MSNKPVINIYGAGMAGLLAASILSKNFEIAIYEKNKEIKNSHHALLRFRDNTIEEYTGIKCKKVQIKKAIFYKNTLFNASNILFDNLYSQKVIGCINTRSIRDLSAGIRYIPPINFYEQLFELNKDKIHMNSERNEFPANKTIISTIPMPTIYKTVCSESIEFKSEEIIVLTIPIENCDVYQTIYFPENDDMNPAYRITITGNIIITELSARFSTSSVQNETTNMVRNQIYSAFGIFIPENAQMYINFQKYGKIINIDENKRQSILYNLTQKHNVYSLGRFACWRNHTMLSDVVQDILKIQKWIQQRNCMSLYEQQKSL